MKQLLATLILSVCLGLPVHAQGTLILAIDMSDSINKEEMDLQMEGYSKSLASFPFLKNVYVEAITFDIHEEVVASGSIDNVRSYFDSFDTQTYINATFGTTRRHMTCTYTALEYIEQKFELYPQPVIVDISTDGYDNCDAGKSFAAIESLKNKGAEINVILIGAMDKRTEDYNEKTIKFNEQLATNKLFMAETFDDFEYVLYEKIQMEVSNLEK